MNFKVILLTGLFAFGFAMTAGAGSIVDTDSDSIPDVFDSCLDEPNGPAQASNQIDTDGDGFGNPCDADFNQNGVVDPNDFSQIIMNFNTASPLHDLNGNGVVDPADFAKVIDTFNEAPGPSGLGCADATIDIGAGDPRCP